MVIFFSSAYMMSEFVVIGCRSLYIYGLGRLNELVFVFACYSNLKLTNVVVRL